MRIVAVCIMTLCLCTLASAQKVYLTLTANPIDDITESPLTQARISLLNPVDSAEVDTFRIVKIMGDLVPRYQYIYENSHAELPFKFIVSAANEGYETSYTDLSILPSEAKHDEVTHKLEPIRLQRIYNHTLYEVAVTASRIMMIMKGDTLVYDANAFRLAEGSMLDALISQLPGVRLEEGGRITVNGHFVSSLLVNGKDFFNGDPNVALQNLPAYMVHKVRAYQKTPDDAYLTRSANEKGARTDDPWVMDVALKRQYAQGYIANAEVAHSVYKSAPMLARLFGLRFSDKSRLAIYATGNNVNRSGSPQTDSGNWQETMKKEGETETAEAGVFYLWENQNRKIRYHSTLTAGIDNANLTQFTSATSFLPGTDCTYTTSFNANRHKNKYVKWDNGFTFVLPKTFLRFSPGISYSYGKNDGRYLSAEGNRLLGNQGLDSVITTNNCGEDFVNLLTSQNIGKTHKWSTNGDVNTTLGLQALHMNPLSLRFLYKYSHESSFDMQHYQLLTADDATDKRNRYDNSPESGYEYKFIVDYPIINIFGARKISRMFFSYSYEQQFKSAERMLYRFDKLGREWMPDVAPIGMLPSFVDSYRNCVDSLNSYHRAYLSRHHAIELRWYYQAENITIQFRLPMDFIRERLFDRRPSSEQSNVRKQAFMQPQFSIKIREMELHFDMQHKLPSQTLMLDVCDNSNPLSIFLGNPSLKSSYEYYFTTAWRGFQQKQMRQWYVGLYLHAIDNAIGSLRRYNQATGGYTYTPLNIDGNRGLKASGNISQSVDKNHYWFINIGSDISLNRSVDFADIGEDKYCQKSIVHNLHVSPTAGVDFRYEKWHASFKVSVDWERLFSEQTGFETLSQVDYLYTISLTAPLPFDIDLDTDLNLFMRRGYSDRAMNTEEWVWNANLSRCLNKQKTWVIKLSIHDLLGQLSAVRRTLNAQGRVETVSNTLTRNIMLHLVWKFNKQPSKR
jgi:hypothetical protein